MMEEAQQFLADRLKSLGVMLAPVPAPAKMVVNLKGSTPRENEYNPGPLVKIGLDGIKFRDDSQIYYDKELGAYGPGRL